jgi:hypothetical protein
MKLAVSFVWALVDVGGRRLHLMEAGAGMPAVVIIPALADNALWWLPVLEACADETLMCAYDRAETACQVARTSARLGRSCSRT